MSGETPTRSFQDTLRLFQQTSAETERRFDPPTRCIPKLVSTVPTRPAVRPLPNPSVLKTSALQPVGTLPRPPVVLSRPASPVSSLTSGGSPVRARGALVADRTALFEKKTEDTCPFSSSSRGQPRLPGITPFVKALETPVDGTRVVTGAGRDQVPALLPRPQPHVLAIVGTQPSTQQPTSASSSSGVSGPVRGGIARQAARFEEIAKTSRQVGTSLCRKVGRLGDEQCKLLLHLAPSPQTGRSRHLPFLPQSADVWEVLHAIERDVLVGRNRLPGAKKVMLEGQTGQLTCGICLDEIEEKDRVELDCRHSMHLACLREQFDFQLGPTGDFPVCCVDCNLPTVMADWKKFYSPDQLMALGHVARRQRMAKSEGAIRGCPTKDCLMIYKVADHPDGIRECQLCKKKHCLDCGVEYHEDVSCAAYQEWRAKNEANAAADAAWLQSQLQSGAMKLCPACKACLEKINGCNYVVCGNCKTPLCWQTGKTRATCGGSHNCH